MTAPSFFLLASFHAISIILRPGRFLGVRKAAHSCGVYRYVLLSERIVSWVFRRACPKRWVVNSLGPAGSSNEPYSRIMAFAALSVAFFFNAQGCLRRSAERLYRQPPLRGSEDYTRSCSRNFHAGLTSMRTSPSRISPSSSFVTMSSRRTDLSIRASFAKLLISLGLALSESE